MSHQEIAKIESEIKALTQKLAQLRTDLKPEPVKSYTFEDLHGKMTLLDLFGNKDLLFVIHNMGQGCRYCTLWADGFNAFIPHLEQQCTVALVSKDSPETQRTFANSRGWRFKMVSHKGGDYIQEQSVVRGEKNMPGMTCYIRKGDLIFKKSSTVFGPGDLYCSLWHILSLAGISIEQWTPQFNYWQRPDKLEDGGKNLI